MDFGGLSVVVAAPSKVDDGSMKSTLIAEILERMNSVALLIKSPNRFWVCCEL